MPWPWQASGVQSAGYSEPRTAGPAVAGLTLLTWLLDLVASDLGLPDWVTQLALSSHMGQPMVGVRDWVGIAACLVLAVGGVALGALGIQRRDVGQ